MLRSVKPIVNGIEELPEGRDVYIKEKGLLSDLAKAINRVSEKLMRQERELRKKKKQGQIGYHVYRTIYAHPFQWLWAMPDSL